MPDPPLPTMATRTKGPNEFLESTCASRTSWGPPDFDGGGVSTSGSGVAAMEGTVTDPDNQPIAGALVVIVSTETGYERSVFTDARGRYFASAMPVGAYLVQASSANFARTVREAVRLSIGATETINFSLKIANILETITVSAAPPRAACGRGAASGSVGPRPKGCANWRRAGARRTNRQTSLRKACRC